MLLFAIPPFSFFFHLLSKFGAEAPNSFTVVGQQGMLPGISFFGSFIPHHQGEGQPGRGITEAAIRGGSGFLTQLYSPTPAQ